MKLDYLFSRNSGSSARRPRQEPRIAGGLGRGSLVPALPEPDDSNSPYSTPMGKGGSKPFGLDPRRMSPRQLADWAHEMYLCRMLNWEEYCMAGFPAELHPHYNRTVGALTGDLAQPDTPRNMLRVWEERLSFALRYFEEDEPEVKRTEKLLGMLKRLVPARV